VASHDRDRVVALSLQLTQAHQELRNRLGDVRANLGENRPTQLATHCLAFCTALTAHHQGEDAGMFTELLRERPDLARTVQNLVDDHEMISSILARVAELSDRAADAGTSASIELELDGLAAIMENHFRYEERAISAALDQGTVDTGWSSQVFRFEPAGEASETA
jgi:hypothetical protein